MHAETAAAPAETVISQNVSEPEKNTTIKVWDPFVRIFHWSVAGICLVNLTVLDDGGQVHRWLGYVAAALLAARTVWGFVGSRHARFADFIPGPRRLAAYLAALARGREPRCIGHNPAAAVMILALAATLTGIAVTGWMTTLDAFWGVDWVEELHESFADALIGLAVVHIAAAVIESVRHRENLILSMITGRKRP